MPIHVTLGYTGNSYVSTSLTENDEWCYLCHPTDLRSSREIQETGKIAIKKAAVNKSLKKALQKNQATRLIKRQNSWETAVYALDVL